MPVNILLVSIGLSYVSQLGVPVIFNFVPEILIRQPRWTIYRVTLAHVVILMVTLTDDLSSVIS